MPRNRRTQYTPVYTPNTSWTGKIQPWSAGNQAIHQEIASEQVTHWTPKQIQAAEKQGYFAALQQRALQRSKEYVMQMICEEEELE